MKLQRPRSSWIPRVSRNWRNSSNPNWMVRVTFPGNLFDFPNIQKKVLRDIIELVIMRGKPRYFWIAGEERWWSSIVWSHPHPLSMHQKSLFPSLLALICIKLMNQRCHWWDVTERRKRWHLAVLESRTFCYPGRYFKPVRLKRTHNLRLAS